MIMESEKMQALPGFKRVVTGHDEQGLAGIASSGPPPNSFPLKAVPGTVFYEVWNSVDSPAPLDNAADPTAKPLQLSPSALGSLIRVVDIPQSVVSEILSGKRKLNLRQIRWLAEHFGVSEQTFI